MEKKCCHCKAVRSVSQFHKMRKSPDGLQGNCKSCALDAVKRRKGRYRTVFVKVATFERMKEEAARIGSNVSAMMRTAIEQWIQLQDMLRSAV